MPVCVLSLVISEVSKSFVSQRLYPLRLGDIMNAILICLIPWSRKSLPEVSFKHSVVPLRGSTFEYLFKVGRRQNITDASKVSFRAYPVNSWGDFTVPSVTVINWNCKI